MQAIPPFVASYAGDKNQHVVLGSQSLTHLLRDLEEPGFFFLPRPLIACNFLF